MMIGIDRKTCTLPIASGVLMSERGNGRVKPVMSAFAFLTRFDIRPLGPTVCASWLLHCSAFPQWSHECLDSLGWG